MLSSIFGRLRLVGWLEGVSYLLLLGVAMPLKYLAGQPMAVKVVGWIHGMLFIGFCLSLWQAMRLASWSMRQTAVPFIAALLPFGTFAIDRKLRAEAERVGDV